MQIKLDDNFGLDENKNQIQNKKPDVQNEQNIRKQIQDEIKYEERHIEESIRKDVEAEEEEFRDKKKRKKKDKDDKNKKIINPNPVTNEDYYQNYKKRIRNNKIKKICVYGTIIGLISLILVLNLYFIFIRERISIPEIAAQVKTINKINTYPEEAVDGYLQEHAYELISDCVELSNGTGAKTFTISNIRVNKIAVRSDNNANVYFSCYINTNIGSESHNFLIPLYYSNETSSFAPSGNLIVCATQNQSTTDPIEVSLWSFEKIKKFDKDETMKLTNFLSNFLEILYNNPGNDLSTFYSGKAILGDYACTFVGIQECSYYQESNAMGLNCEVIYTVKSNEGVVFTVHNYLAVKKNGERYEIIHFY